MPVYEYECSKCGTVMEQQQSIKDNKLEELLCTQCNTVEPVKKIITSMHFKLVGRGWAHDGYADHYGHALDLV